MNDTVVQRLIPLREAAKLSGIGYENLLRAAKRGELQAVTVGNHFRVTAESLNAFVARIVAGSYVIESRAKPSRRAAA